MYTLNYGTLIRFPIDIRTYRTWHSETYMAIANRHEFHHLREKRKRELTGDLTEMLRILAPAANAHNLATSIYKDIIEPAFTLAHKLSLSVDLFTIEWSPFHNLKSDQRGHLQ